ncbi:MAG: hypothetical protein FJX51_08815, partial [Alphaproteobacteria bacterium]|nr:hypothetical protein [Alphaproteobacteria bacterium]
MAAFVLLAVAAACGPLTSEQLADARAMKPAGNAFQNALWKEYLFYGDWELQQGDLDSAERNIAKAVMAAKGQTPAPNDPSKSTKLAPDKMGQLMAGYM